MRGHVCFFVILAVACAVTPARCLLRSRGIDDGASLQQFIDNRRSLLDMRDSFDIKLVRLDSLTGDALTTPDLRFFLDEGSESEYFRTIAQDVELSRFNGSYTLTKDQIKFINAELEAAVEPELEPASITIPTPVTLVGTKDVSQYGIPPLLVPSALGRAFVVPRAFVLNFSNVTLWLPDYAGDLSSPNPEGIPPGVFDIEIGGRLCFMNSTMMMKRCVDQDFQLFCLNAAGVNFYGSSFVEAQAPEFQAGLKGARQIQCISIEGSSSSTTTRTILMATIPTIIVFLTLCGAITFWRYRRYRRTKEQEVETVKQEVATVMQEKEKVEREKSRMETMYYDLLKNNEGVARSNLTRPVGAQNTDTRLMFMEQKDPSNIQRQLQSMLSGSDEAITVQGEIGRGAFGVVYQGIWKNMQVAIKTVLFQTSGEQLKDDPVIREATIAMRISHMHLVATYCANVRVLDDGFSSNAVSVTGSMRSACQLFLVQEFCDAGTLYDWLSKSRLHPLNVPDKAVIVRCALDIALGIQALHKANIVHGDLKPQNVLLTTMTKSQRKSYSSPSPPAWPYIGKLTDFGLSFKLEENKSHLSGLHIGTPFYFAPEVQGRGYLSMAADMYSFGVLLWELYHGMPPYTSDKGHLVANHLFPRFSLRHRADAPFSYCVLALACLSKNYQERPTIDEAVAVLEDLNRSINCDTPEAREADTVMRMASVSRLTKSPGEQGLLVPASLVAEAGRSAPPKPPRAQSYASQPDTSEKASAAVDVAPLVLSLLDRSGLKRDPVLFQRLAATNSSEKRKLAGMSMSSIVGTPAEGGIRNVHGHNPALFDLLPPSSVVRQGEGAAPADRRDTNAGRQRGRLTPDQSSRLPYNGDSVADMHFSDRAGNV